MNESGAVLPQELTPVNLRFFERENNALREAQQELGHVEVNESGAVVSQEITPADFKGRLRFLEILRGAQHELNTKH